MNVNLYALLALLAAFQVKHFLCDYPLQRPYMLRKGAVGWNWTSRNNLNWILPLAAHAGVHALATLLIALVVNPRLGWLSILDFVVHFVVDRVKASPQLGGRWTPAQPYFWWALGGDQMAHHLTHYAIIAALLSL
jgi:hypothetical protein